MSENEEILRDYISLKGLEIISKFVVKYVGDEVASSYKSARFDENTKTVSLYTKALADENDTPDFSFVIPDPDLSVFIKKITGGTVGNVVTVGEEGIVVDSGISLNNLATKDDVAEAIAGNFEKEIVDETRIEHLIANPNEAKNNVLYLVKDESSTGDDKYKEYTLLTVTETNSENGEEIQTKQFVCIGDTSVSWKPLEDAVKRIDALENKVGDGFVEVTEEQISAMWNDVIAPSTEETE